MADRVIVCVGTRRGLFVFESSAARARWTMRGPLLKGWQIYHAAVDTRGTPRLHVAASSEVFATTTFEGGLKDRALKGAKRPPVPPKLLPKQMKWIKKWGISTTPRVWHIEPGHAAEKKVLYAGTAPAALFRSEDEGRTWEEVKSLTRHPSRKDWQPGNGGMCLHSIQRDPFDSNKMYVAISSAGAFRSDDAGASWKPINKAVARFTGAPKSDSVGT